MKKHQYRKSVISLFLFSMLFILTSNNVVFGQQKKDSKPPYVAEIQRSLKDFDILNKRSIVASQDILQKGIVQLESKFGIFNLQMDPFDVRSDNYHSEIVGNKKRLTVSGKNQSIRTYRGIYLGLANSEVRFTIDKNTFEGTIITPRETYFIEKAQNFTKKAGADRLIIYRSSDVISSFGSCGVGISERIEGALQKTGISKFVSDPKNQFVNNSPGLRLLFPLKEVEIATDADYEYVRAAGSGNAAKEEILGIINQIDGIYGNQIGIRFRVVFQNAYETSNDPYTQSFAPLLLEEFVTYWNAQHTNIIRDVAVLWTGKTPGNFGGLAKTDTACNVPASAYAFSKRFDELSHKSVTAAHEIGHTFGATHSDETQPSECVGTIMSRELNSNFSFCPFSFNQIINHVNSNPSCFPSLPDSASGTPDPSFGTNGVVLTDFGSRLDTAGSVLVQPDSKIIVAGKSGEALALARYNPNGTLDSTFGTNGKVVNPCGGAKSILLQPDGKIILAGRRNEELSTGCLIRFNSDGTLDTSFAHGSVTGINTAGYTTSAVLQQDGKIILGGGAIVNNRENFSLTRFTRDGIIDTWYGTNGTVTVNLDGVTNVINALALQSDGKIVAVGRQSYPTQVGNFQIVRFLPDGRLDLRFGLNGHVVRFPSTYGYSAAYSVAIDNTGRIVVGGRNSRPGIAYFSTQRYTTDGIPDISFGQNGEVLTPFGGVSYCPTDEPASSLVLQRDGKIVIGASVGLGEVYSHVVFALIRYSSTGALDETFGYSGKIIADFGPSSNPSFSCANALTLAPDGNIIQVGSNATRDFAIVRYLNTIVLNK